MTVLLALDSSTEVMAISLSGPSGELFFEAEGGPQASARLVPETQALLAQAGLRLGDVDAIAFGRGPGAFTGLRAACAVVQGLAFGVGKPVLAVDSLMLVAEDARQQAAEQGAPLSGLVWVAMDARMGEIYAAAFRLEGAASPLIEVHAAALYKPQVLAELFNAETEPFALAGSALLVFAEALAPAAYAVARRLWPQSRSRARALAALARQAWAQGGAMDAAQAMPVYVRDKVAQTTQERLDARAAQLAASQALPGL